MRRNAGDDIGDMGFHRGEIDSCRGAVYPHLRIALRVMRRLCRGKQRL